MLHARGRMGVDWTAVDRAVREKSRAGSPEDFESCEDLVVPASAGAPQRHAASASSVANLSAFEPDSDLSDFEDY